MLQVQQGGNPYGPAPPRPRTRIPPDPSTLQPLTAERFDAMFDGKLRKRK